MKLNGSEAEVWERAVLALIPTKGDLLAFDLADQIVGALRSRLQPPETLLERCRPHSQEETNCTPLGEGGWCAHEAADMLVREGPFGDVTKHVIEAEHQETRRRHAERQRLQTKLDANVDSEWDPNLQDFVEVDRPLPEYVRSNLIAAIERLDKDLAERLDVRETGVRHGIFVNPDQPSSKICVEFDRGELCPGARYAVQWEGVLVGYEKEDAAREAFQATKQNMAPGETLNLLLLVQAEHYVAPEAQPSESEPPSGNFNLVVHPRVMQAVLEESALCESAAYPSDRDH